MGRHSNFKPEYSEQAFKLCLLGATDKELADFFRTSEQTLNAWKKKYPEFLESLKAGKADADAEVARRLFDRTAIDTTACIFWLKNRRKESWRDKQEIEHSGEQTHNHTIKEIPPELLEMIKYDQD